MKSWGKNDGMKGDPGLCPRCLKDDWNRKSSSLVGFSNDEKYCGDLTRNKIGAFFIECPKCFKIYWFHVNGWVIDVVAENILRDPGYLKVPGALEDYLKENG